MWSECHDPTTGNTESGEELCVGRNPDTFFAVTIDVEADNEWGDTGDPTYWGIASLPRFQQLCDGCGIHPTYLVTFDVASHHESAEVLRDLASDGNCEIGAHMHPWRTPPFSAHLDSNTSYHPYLYDYSPDLQARKMQTLTHCLEDVFQRPMTSHRAGRWGIDAYGCDLLEENGYIVDTSVAPLRDHRSQLGHPGGAEGPSFMAAPAEPYHPSHSDVSARGRRKLFEIPASTCAVGPGMPWNVGLVRAVGALPFAARTGLRFLRRIFCVRVIAFNPARHGLVELQALIECLLAQERSVLNMAFHSSELIPGASPAVPTATHAERVWKSLEVVLGRVEASDSIHSCGLTPAALTLMKVAGGGRSGAS